MLWALGARSTRIAIRLDELRDVPRGSTALLVLRPAELTSANMIRPMFRARRLRMVLMADDETVARAQLDAPDLLDWVSDVVEATPVVPRFVPLTIEPVAAHFPGFAWLGDPASAVRALATTFGGPPCRITVDPSRYAQLVSELSRVRGWCLVPVPHEVAALRLRLALAESRRAGRVVALGHSVPGWPTIDPAALSWKQLDALAPRIDGALAARAHCEPAALTTPVHPAAEAFAGQCNTAVTRRTLLDPGRAVLRREARVRALRAVRAGLADGEAFVAAWADRTRTLLDPMSMIPRLGMAAMPALIRSGTSRLRLAELARHFVWFDIESYWRGQSPETDRDERLEIAAAEWSRMLDGASEAVSRERLADARRQARAVVELQFRDAGPASGATAILAWRTGQLLLGIGEWAEAEKLLVEGLRLLEYHGVLTPRVRSQVHLDLATLARDRGDLADAAASLHETLDLLVAAGRAGSNEALRALIMLWDISMRRGRRDDARAALERWFRAALRTPDGQSHRADFEALRDRLLMRLDAGSAG